MKAKMLEIRDKATFIPVLAINLESENEEQRYLLGRAGYGTTADRQRYFVILIKMVGEITAHLDSFDWPGSGFIRTMPVAHKFIQDHFDTLKDGDVIDVEYILGETKHCKVSERYGQY